MLGVVKIGGAIFSEPSMEKVALKGLKKGLQAGFATIEVEMTQKIEENRLKREERVTNLKQIINQCEVADSGSNRIENETLNRMLVES